MTPSGQPAVFRSFAHAWFALRLAYLADTGGAPELVAATEHRYQSAWQRYVRHCEEVHNVVAAFEAGDLESAAGWWAPIDQHEADAAFTTVICEREPYPLTNLGTMACRHFGLSASGSIARSAGDRPSGSADNEAAWHRDGGLCRGCRTTTISQRQHDRLRRAIVNHGDLFDLTPT
jgi:hypothetical protein